MTKRLLPWLLAVLLGLLAVAAHAQTTAPVLRIETGTHSAWTRDAAADAAGRVLVTVSDDKTARVWSLPDLQPRGVLRPPIGVGDDGKLYAVAVSPDGRFAAVGGCVGLPLCGRLFLLLFDLQTRQIVRSWGGLPNVVGALAFSQDGGRLAAGVGSNGVRVFDTNGGEVFHDTDYYDSVFGVAFAPDGRLATASLDGAARVYDRTGALLHKAYTEAGHDPIKIAFSPDGRELAVGFGDANAIEILDGGTLALLARPDTGGLNRHSPDERLLRPPRGQDEPNPGLEQASERPRTQQSAADPVTNAGSTGLCAGKSSSARTSPADRQSPADSAAAQHRGGGSGRSAAMVLRMSWNKLRDTATSAI